MTRISFSDADNRMMLAKEFDDLSSEKEIEDDDYIPSGDDGETDVTVPAPDISDGEAEEYQRITEETPQISFSSKTKTEKWMIHPKFDSKGIPRIHNKKTGQQDMLIKMWLKFVLHFHCMFNIQSFNVFFQSIQPFKV